MARELRAYFFSPLGWVIATGFLFFNGLIFQTIVDYLNDPRAAGVDDAAGLLLRPHALLLAGDAVRRPRCSPCGCSPRSGAAARSRCCSRRRSPRARWCSASTSAPSLFYSSSGLPTLVYVALLAQYRAARLGADRPPPTSASLGIGALFLAIGVFTSAVTRNQVVAAVLSFASRSSLLHARLLEFLVNDPKVRDALRLPEPLPAHGRLLQRHRRQPAARLLPLGHRRSSSSSPAAPLDGREGEVAMAAPD